MKIEYTWEVGNDIVLNYVGLYKECTFFIEDNRVFYSDTSTKSRFFLCKDEVIKLITSLQQALERME
jgi:hypothetical protein